MKIIKLITGVILLAGAGLIAFGFVYIAILAGLAGV